MQSLIHSLSQSALGLWGSVFALFCLLLVIALLILINGRAKTRDEIVALMTEKLEERKETDNLRIQQSLNETIQKANSSLRVEMAESLNRLSQSQQQNMVGFADLIQKMNQGNASTQLQAREALKAQVTQLSSGINQELNGIRETLNRQLQTLQTNNDAKL